MEVTQLTLRAMERIRVYNSCYILIKVLSSVVKLKPARGIITIPIQIGRYNCRSVLCKEIEVKRKVTGTQFTPSLTELNVRTIANGISIVGYRND